MKYHALIFAKIKKDVVKLSTAAVVICALRVKKSKSKMPMPFCLQKILWNTPIVSTLWKPEPNYSERKSMCKQIVPDPTVSIGD